jgi:tricorn protease
VYAGDIWAVPIAGGQARQLTSGDHEELFPRFSPDGTTIAFTGQYDGRRQVYVIPVTGGTPRQLTFYNDATGLPPRGGVDHRVLGWTPDGRRCSSTRTARRGAIASPDPTWFPPPAARRSRCRCRRGAGGSLSPDGRRYAYTPVMREFRTWKRYRGGRAQDVWIYDLATHAAERITDFAGTDNQPVVAGRHDLLHVGPRRERQAEPVGARRAHEGRRGRSPLTTATTCSGRAPGRAAWCTNTAATSHRYDPASGRTALVPIHVERRPAPHRAHRP